ncbi:hypothetical protein JD504_15370 [Aeromonas hydrophila]|uniref:hypothetical protein n=1 Tax=Aeromonas hydrophila TaxID=644 RepID=UPI00191D02C0|nr:hypothetical protein [Aeromonas hydrophila]MBL0672137.1 hypothetical protein [Aeromonas hydrophila]
MVIREFIVCSTCENSYTLRIGVGFDPIQRHFFDCIHCYQTIGIELNASQPPNAYVRTFENCSIKHETNDGIVMNLHPNCAFPVNHIHDPLYFASMTNMRLISKVMKLRPGKFQDVATQFDLPNAGELWKTIKTIINMEDKNVPGKIYNRQLQAYNSTRKKHGVHYNIQNSADALHDFLDSLFYPKINNISQPIISLIDSLFNQDKLNDFIKFYDSEILEQNKIRYLSILSDYFKYRDILGQIVTHARIDNDDVDNLIVASKNFDDVKLYYGQAYETLTSHFTILACLNNLLSGRRYDEFKAMTLNKYINDLEKAKKHNPFKDEGIFEPFTECLDSSLRNGSHHASIWRDGEVIKYRSGGTGAEKDISYSRYLHYCNKITISIAALLLIELKIKSLKK